jgi:lipopolysaccharide transport system permease protein
MSTTRYTTEITPGGQRSVLANLRDFWAFRELIFFFVARDFIVRYKQSALGVAWVILQPVALMLIFTFVFGQVARISSPGVPYPVFIYTALVLWQFYSFTLSRVGTSIVGNAHLVSKAYFPRLVIPFSAGLVGVIDFAVSFLLLLGLMVYYGMPFGLQLLTLPLFLFLGWMSAFGAGLWLTALHVRYRDVTVVLPLFLQIMTYATPIAYPASLVPQRWQQLYFLNPITPLVEGFRWSVLGTGSVPWSFLLLSTVVSLLVLISGLVYFQKSEGLFADEI